MMQPLTALNNVQKARLLHALLLQEIPPFLEYTSEMCVYIVNHTEEVQAVWNNPLISFGLWVELSKDAHLKILKYGRNIERSSSLFADQLFDGYGACFLVHCLTTYVEQCKHTDPKFTTAVELFFHP
ncbi:hypothetical protein FFF34_002880 [Inquilinus sp. KBS0705]|nr:hypothetical protein FFF34_002880 [Inquilinus sp. KBS0705]